LYIGVTRTLTQDRDEFGTIGTSEGEESLGECGRNPADRCCKHGEQAGEEYASARLPRALCKSDKLTLLHDSAIPDDYFFEDLTFYTGAADLQPIGSLGLLAMTAQRQ
jgi:hypothetical protein